MRPADQDFGAGSKPERSVGVGADVSAGERAVVKSIGRGHHGPDQDAAAAHAKIEAQPADMAAIVLGRSIIGSETAPDVLARADNEAEACRRPASEHADFGAA